MSDVSTWSDVFCQEKQMILQCGALEGTGYTLLQTKGVNIKQKLVRKRKKKRQCMNQKELSLVAFQEKAFCHSTFRQPAIDFSDHKLTRDEDGKFTS